MQQAIDELAPYLELRSLAVSVSVDPNLGAIDVDQAKIADVLTNLLANAIKFTPDGGTIRIEARTEPSDDKWVRISVRDEGAGVSEADQQHLFEPFFTGFDTLRHSSGEYQFGKRGIGLGLWLVKTFVELHGGRVEVSSAPGAGLDLRVRAAEILGDTYKGYSGPVQDRVCKSYARYRAAALAGGGLKSGSNVLAITSLWTVPARCRGPARQRTDMESESHGHVGDGYLIHANPICGRFELDRMTPCRTPAASFQAKGKLSGTSVRSRYAAG